MQVKKKTKKKPKLNLLSKQEKNINEKDRRGGKDKCRKEKEGDERGRESRGKG